MHSIPDTESLQPEEQEVVEAAAANRGSFQIVTRPETRGPVIQAGQKKLFQKDQPAFAKRCCESVSRLIELQLVRETGGQKRYELTNFGWQLSRKLSLEKRNSRHS